MNYSNKWAKTCITNSFGYVSIATSYLCKSVTVIYISWFSRNMDIITIQMCSIL